MVLKQGDFIELDYTGSLEDEKTVFDTTLASAAKESGIAQPNVTYAPVIVCIGKGQIIKGLENNLIGKEVGKEYEFKISSEEGFGNKNPKLIQLISTNKFKSQKINPMPGLQVNIDGSVGTIRTVSGGRTIVDFNHPLSGKNLIYRVTVKRTIEDVNEKIKAVLSYIGVQFDHEFLDGLVTLTNPDEVPKNIQDGVSDALKDMILDIKQVSFKTVTKKEEQKTDSNNKI